MTRDELIEVIVRTLIGKDAEDRHVTFCRQMGENVLSAIEAAGLAIVPVEATQYQLDEVCSSENIEPWTDEIMSGTYRAMIEAGKL